MLTLLVKAPVFAFQYLCGVSNDVIYRLSGINVAEWVTLHLWKRKIPIYRLTAAGLRPANRTAREIGDVIPISEIARYVLKDFRRSMLDECVLKSGEVITTIGDEESFQVVEKQGIEMDFTQSPVQWYARFHSRRRLKSDPPS